MEGVMAGVMNGLPSPNKIKLFSASCKSKLHSSFRSTSYVPSNCAPISCEASKLHFKRKLYSSTPTKRRSPVSHSSKEAAFNDIQHSSDLTASLARSGKILKVADLNIIMRDFWKSKRWKDLSQLFEWMRKNGKINVASYSSYMKFMTETKDVSRALNAYETISDESMRNNTSICNSVLSCMVKNNMFDGAIKLFHQMKQNGLQPDVVTYSTLMAGCSKVECGYSKTLELLGELEDKGIVMDSVIYGTLIAVCASNNKCEEAEMYFMRMKAEGHAPNVYHCSSLLNAYAIDGNYEMADKLVQDMKSSGLVPNKVVMTTLLKVYVNGGLLDKSRSLLSELEALGYAEDEMPYCQLMDGLTKSGKIVEAEVVFDHMSKRQVRSDGFAQSIMISAYCRTGQLEKAKHLARVYEAMSSKNDLVILNVMLCAYCRAGDMENVMQIMRKMDKLAIIPDQKTFEILIKYFIKENLYLLACRTLQDMHNKGHRLEEELLSSFIVQLGRVGAHSEAYIVYNVLRNSGQAIQEPLNRKMLHILISGNLLEEAYEVIKDNARLMSPLAVERFLGAFMRSGNVNLINEVLEAVNVSGHVINQNVFHLAVSRFIARPEMKEELLQLLQWISRHGFSIDTSTRNLILKNSLIWSPTLHV
ncbi:hypothetical protein RND81_11G070200 [Saponaria officinalis]|uniref:Pentatricopeptide repeat-containing protein n=1 Tax=Saponaria officinalis TaxID=3572 RepID=A0AAW1HJ61_SAPOF